LPGAPGIGAKTAAELLQAHGTLEGVLQAAREGTLRPRLASALIENETQLADFKRIATLQPIEVDLPAGAPTDHANGARAATELGMRRLAERLEKSTTA
jgi:DNA polymerase-1